MVMFDSSVKITIIIISLPLLSIFPCLAFTKNFQLGKFKRQCHKHVADDGDQRLHFENAKT